MKSAKEVFNEMGVGLQTATRWIEIIEQAQTEAWNEAITEANKHAKAKIVSVKSSFDESKYEKRCVVIESSILNLKK